MLVALAAHSLGSAACGARTALPGDGPGEGGGAGGGLTTSSFVGPASVSASTGAPACALVEGCNGLDDDCDGAVDEDCIDVGCSDGQREGFVDVVAFPDIAACSGGFGVAGITAAVPACGNATGDDAADPSGAGCSAADLCAPGWTVCPGEGEVARLAGSCAGASEFSSLFFATAQSGPGCGICALGTDDDPASCDCVCTEGCAPRPWTTNDLFGCGSIGDVTTRCGVLDRFSNNLCDLLDGPWECNGTPADGAPATCREATLVRKTGPELGGVLCCRAIREEG